MKCSIVIMFVGLSITQGNVFSWPSAIADAGIAFTNCSNTPSAHQLISCLKKLSLSLLDDAVNSDVIPLSSGVNLRTRGSGRALTGSGTRYVRGRTGDQVGWTAQVLDRVAGVLRTHILQIDLKGLVQANEARRRHHRNRMWPLMMFGVTALGMVLVPMGFQFLAVLGGKALLMAKMALLLASIQGLKKVHNGGVNYGLYHAIPTHYEHHFHDRHTEPYDQGYPAYNAYPDGEVPGVIRRNA